MSLANSFCDNKQELINHHIEETRQAILGAHVKNMKKVANKINDNVRSVLEETVNDYKKFRKDYLPEETARWHAGTNKVKDPSFSKDRKTLENALLKSRNKLELVACKKHGDISKIIEKVKTKHKNIF